MTTIKNYTGLETLEYMRQHEGEEFYTLVQGCLHVNYRFLNGKIQSKGLLPMAFASEFRDVTLPIEDTHLSTPENVFFRVADLQEEWNNR